MTRFNKNTMNKTKKTILNHQKKNKTLPTSVKMTEMDNNKTLTINKAQYMGLYEAQNLFYKNNNRQPNYVTLNSTATNPVILMHQPNSYTCCPTSLQMCIQYLFEFKSINEISKALQTNTNGTTPTNLINGAKKLGYKTTTIPRTYEAVKESLDNGYPVIAHIETGGTTKPTCLGYINNYRHYIHINKAKDNKYTILDPTKGIKTCKADTINKATNGRNIQYYKIQPQ